MPKLLEEVCGNDEAQNEAILAFIENSANGTLHHSPRFLAYHSAQKLRDRGVEFRHIVFREGCNIVGFIPGAVLRSAEEVIYSSPWGASVGGMVVAESTRFSLVDEMVTRWKEHLVDWNVKTASTTLTPTCFQCDFGTEAVEYSMERHGFRTSESAMLLSTPIRLESGFPQCIQGNDARRRTRRALDAGCEVTIDANIDAFWPILKESMLSNSATPTHNEEELVWIQRNFPNNFEIYLCWHNGVAIAGILVLQMNRVSKTTFYMCSRSDYRHFNPMNLLVTKALERSIQCKWLDFGPSTFGYELHESLIRFKEQNGGIPVQRRKLTCDFASPGVSND